MKSVKLKEELDPEKLFAVAEEHEERGEFKRAFNCLLKAARIGHAGSQLNLGNFYSDGKGIGRNTEEAARWYKEAYKNGDRSGALNLAIDLRRQGKVRSAVAWFKKAIAMRAGSAYLELAKMYKSGRSGQKVAVGPLRQALMLSPSDLSDDEREEAQSLLYEILKHNKKCT
ncbi:tetratricopeptide repeat protein [Acidicapsa ligni]|uniref:tetratricopeptide repeat protein n=1 Tax=Acidicapsa ligni TaxID=542300 RepID=UPI0021E0BC16|nr:hypothetical protein [Acidicapsa ligni]